MDIFRKLRLYYLSIVQEIHSLKVLWTARVYVMLELLEDF